MYMCAPGLEAATPTVFMVWRRSCTNASTYTLDYTNTNQLFKLGSKLRYLCQKHFTFFFVLVSKLPKISLLPVRLII
jgi:hypothetical protein